MQSSPSNLRESPPPSTVSGEAPPCSQGRFLPSLTRLLSHHRSRRRGGGSLSHRRGPVLLCADAVRQAAGILHTLTRELLSEHLKVRRHTILLNLELHCQKIVPLWLFPPPRPSWPPYWYGVEPAPASAAKPAALFTPTAGIVIPVTELTEVGIPAGIGMGA